MNEEITRAIKVLRAVGQDEAVKVLEAIHADDPPPNPDDPPSVEPRTPGSAIGRDEALTMSRAELEAFKHSDRAGYEATMTAVAGRDASGGRAR